MSVQSCWPADCCLTLDAVVVVVLSTKRGDEPSARRRRHHWDPMATERWTEMLGLDRPRRAAAAGSHARAGGQSRAKKPDAASRASRDGRSSQAIRLSRVETERHTRAHAHPHTTTATRNEGSTAQKESRHNALDSSSAAAHLTSPIRTTEPSSQQTQKVVRWFPQSPAPASPLDPHTSPR